LDACTRYCVTVPEAAVQLTVAEPRPPTPVGVPGVPGGCGVGVGLGVEEGRGVGVGFAEGRLDGEGVVGLALGRDDGPADGLGLCEPGVALAPGRGLELGPTVGEPDGLPGEPDAEGWRGFREPLGTWSSAVRPNTD